MENSDKDIVMGEKNDIVENKVKRANLNEKNASNTSTVAFHSSIPNFDNSFSLQKFSKNFKIKFHTTKKSELVFDMIGIDAPVANALRRIMLAEVPTVAIEKVVVNNNTSVLPDEILAHRLGLIPIKVDPQFFRTKENMIEEQTKNALDFERKPSKKEEYEPREKICPNEDVLFKLKVHCKEVHGQLVNNKVYSRDLKWIPIGNQQQKFLNNPIAPVHKDILICVLGKGQEIDFDIYAEKGIGKTHAKWSPVSTASYRLMPEIIFKEKITGKEAIEIKSKCKVGVFDIEEIGGIETLKIKNEKSLRKCKMCRECIRGSTGKSKINLRKIKNHFIFSIESTGVMSSAQIFRDAIGIFYRKCLTKINFLNDIQKQRDNMDDFINM